MQLPAGYLTDHVGERVVLVGVMVMGPVGLAGFNVPPTYALFPLMIAVFGSTTGLYRPARGTVVLSAYPERDGTAFGVMLAAGSIGSAILPALAAYVVVPLGWRSTLSIATPVFLISALSLWRTVPGSSEALSSDPADLSVGAVLRWSLVVLGDRRLVLAIADVVVMLFVFQGVTAFLRHFSSPSRGFHRRCLAPSLGPCFSSVPSPNGSGAAAQTRSGHQSS